MRYNSRPSYILLKTHIKDFIETIKFIIKFIMKFIMKFILKLQIHNEFTNFSCMKSITVIEY